MKNYRHLVMIYRGEYRKLADGCATCNKSLVFCAANRDHNREACCEFCAHPG